jgi:RimJ/RimL family protein N-acetyltransferase
MNSTDVYSRGLPLKTHSKAECAAQQNKPSIRVKELCERDRRSLLMHMLALDSTDRLLRFGSVLPDELITKYVQRINFTRDAVFGVFDSQFDLVGVGHLAYIPRETWPCIAESTSKDRTAEFGVSVSASSRGLGIGSKLFQRAEMHCRNEDIDTLHVHCLTTNHAMMHLATKAGMVIHSKHGEAEAFLQLSPANPSSMMREAVDEQVASFDYALKTNTQSVSKWLDRFPIFKLG